ncbi:hypothetical protein BJY01DRAFT_76352 [Aspergillus pseudoustus]|uniref:5'-3' DNA helicase ZGRF1-like N-terminal domain-containing protein n=1 Tax=Aspergillus pseudoustus TaxID=1810923 RepID=A0ABR4J662_9EURO
MSTPRSSGPPRASNLTVPATQGTAPVLKFRCLFTHDMRRKAKRWQDGFLRFHTFNKRVMVYDNGGYFIGDLHYRAPEGIHDGDELELDKGVLVQVCEPLEQTETDLSSLYKIKPTTSPPHAPETPSSVRAATPRPLPSQQASRSLNDLLGIRKTPAPQTRSPYQQSQKQISAPQYERPAKRLRTASPERAGPPGAQAVVDLSYSPPRPQQAAASVPRQNPLPRLHGGRSTAVTRPQLHTVSSRNDISEPNGTTRNRLLHTIRDPAPRSNNSTTITRELREPARDIAPKRPETAKARPPQSDLLARYPGNPPSQPQDNGAAVQIPPAINGDITFKKPETTQNPPPQPVARDVRPNLGPDTPINPLRLSCGNPRRKLMYRESQTRPQSERR